ncbi:hypothetical protein FGIG_11948 [Fasciola gigantica]|uniref:Uncharacterized protein n=1 Tax=Fasciola gigantica TaxID=46835 RepID=A0A504YYT1_FASGI|nr:hypothetical protein FGIG_11948 [Fasciola gigantica]
MSEENQPENRLAKLEKQREIIRKKQKQKHAHEVMSLQARTETAGTIHNEMRVEITRKTKKTSKPDFKPGWASYAYDGPQAYDLANPDDLCTSSEVQVIRVSSMHEQGDIGQSIDTSKPMPKSSVGQHSINLTSDDEFEPQGNGEPADPTVLCNPSTTPAVPARLSLNGDSRLPVCTEDQASVPTQPQTPPASRVVDWTRDSLSSSINQSHSVHPSPVDPKSEVLDDSRTTNVSSFVWRNIIDF